MLRLPHPIVLMLGGVAVAAVLTWVLPAGEYQRRDDPATGRRVVVPGTYHAVQAAPVGLLGAAVAVPKGIAAAAEVIAVVLLVGGAWVMLDRAGTLGRAVGALVRRFRRRGLWAIPIVAFVFAALGALENLGEEIIPLVPVLLLLGAGIGVDALVVVAISVGAAAVGSAFGPTNPFQAGIALKLAELPPLSGAGIRLGMLAAGFGVWVLWTLRYAARHRTEPMEPAAEEGGGLSGRDALMLALAVGPILAYVVGALRLGWGFNELSGMFLLSGIGIGLLARMGVGGTTETFLEGMQAMLPAALMVGVARSISVVLEDGRIIDTILHGLATPLGAVPAGVAALLMIPFHAVLHLPVPSVSGHAALTMPVLVPLSDLLGLSRQVTVLAYQTGAGLMELLAPTNGVLMAVLLAARVPFQRWFRFAVGGWLLLTLVGVAGILVAMARGT